MMKCTYASAWVSDLLDVFEEFTEILLLPHGETIVVEDAHPLSESTTGVVERKHATNCVSGTTFEGAWSCGSEWASLERWDLHGLLTILRLFAVLNATVERAEGADFVVGSSGKGLLTSTTDAAYLEEA